MFKAQQNMVSEDFFSLWLPLLLRVTAGVTDLSRFLSHALTKFADTVCAVPSLTNFCHSLNFSFPIVPSLIIPDYAPIGTCT